MGPEPKRFEVIVSSSLSPPKNLFVEVRNCEFFCQASGCHYTDILSLSEYGSASAKNRWLKPCVGLGRCLADQSGGRTWPTTRSMTIPQEIAVSFIVAVCAVGTGRLAWSVLEFVYWVLT